MMKPLYIALCTKAISPIRFERDGRNVGMFSYAVPEFTWQHVSIHKWNDVDTRDLAAQGFDLIFHEDGAWARYDYDALPVAFYVWESTLSDDYYQQRLSMAREADLLLIDHDRLERFEGLGKPVRRLSHCVNDRIFRDYGEGKSVDVASHMNTGGPCGEGRKELGRHLGRWCATVGYSYAGDTMGVELYARSMSAARVTANWPRCPENRSHRVLDAMACRTCLVTGPVPDVSGEERVAGRDYVEAGSYQEFLEVTGELLDSGRWREIADNGYKLVQEHHTWTVRARYLREVLHNELGL
jgi:glycosyltransferase involved in cell wall biosynthesis